MPSDLRLMTPAKSTRKPQARDNARQTVTITLAQARVDCGRLCRSAPRPVSESMPDRPRPGRMIPHPAFKVKGGG